MSYGLPQPYYQAETPIKATRPWEVSSEKLPYQPVSIPPESLEDPRALPYDVVAKSIKEAIKAWRDAGIHFPQDPKVLAELKAQGLITEGVKQQFQGLEG